MLRERVAMGIAAGSVIIAAVSCCYAWRQQRLLREARTLLSREAQGLLAVASHDSHAANSMHSTGNSMHSTDKADRKQTAQPRSWRTHLVGLDKMISELLCEARLLAAELNKGGDVTAIIKDPLAPTVTAERRLTEGVHAETVVQREPSGRDVLRALRQTLGSFEPGKLRTKVIGVCGMSCSGKSTVSSVLRLHAARNGAYVPVICLDDSYHAWMDDPPSPEQPTLIEPAAALGTRSWKSWESSACVDWQQFLDRLQAKLEVHYGYTPLILIEGFLLLEDDTVARTCRFCRPMTDPDSEPSHFTPSPYHPLSHTPLRW